MRLAVSAGPRVDLGPDDRSFVSAVVRRVLRGGGDTEDVTQDAMLLAFRYRDQFRGDAHYRSWLYRIAWTAAVGHLRRARRRPAILDGATAEIADPARSPEALVSARETAAAVWRAIEQLAPKYRDALMMRLDGLSEVEISRRLSVSVAVVKIRAHRARHQLRETLGSTRPV